MPSGWRWWENRTRPGMVDLLDAALLVHAGKPRRECIVASDRRFSDLDVRHLGDRERWRGI